MKNYRTRSFVLAATLAAVLGIARSSGRLPRIIHSRTIRILVPNAPGGLVDILPRVLGQKITETTKQAVVVENRIGGNGAVAGAEVARSAPDGYTLLMSFHALNAMLPHMTSKLTFDPNKDLVPIVHIMTVPNILVVHPSVPANSVKELVAYGKANPGKLTFASQGVGSTGHVAGELFKQLTDIDIVHVPYRGAAPAAQALMGGQVTMMFDVVTLAMEPVKAGRMRALGVATAKRVDVHQRCADIGGSRFASGNQRLVRADGTRRNAASRSSRGSTARPTRSLPRRKSEIATSRKAHRFLSARRRHSVLHIAAEYQKWGPVIRRANIRID